MEKAAHWKLVDWESTIAQIVEESNQATKKSKRNGILLNWRAQLEEAQSSLRVHQIDEIMREIQRRLSANNK